ncbi:MAG: type II and III secretion system protein family protein [Pseudodesulfovibrio sp.]|uniref:Type II and III secretion system protein n=1 Tax=Pseudodesulfovibrio aespoeensis (strain ATCC 700646 / DSM 10631 / Aspo-2) TaxID=643562 RepID=E6VYP0_PSEA9|nr:MULTISPECIES: type II and III secretion system protein family protein [Pseudodesulfovibrio]MBU4192654.1 type II and III secretion system protein family protein [Pseudomonadota bacterium]ADU63907.1 type II and III secretion system protein [Pseudodesulfovibrio aespoeensis Aspo-2]MBU4243586.1 type II and III secretion system protein family protein [Pseudomonadota bacterium]MBU4378241.1 type II and III secretion system protein family protein [Pseudomonadota bacterium]MBU4475426.1 type II and II
MKTRPPRSFLLAFLMALAVTVSGLVPLAVADVDVLNTEAPGVISLVVSKSTILTADAPVSRVSLAQPETASVVVLSPTQIYITGRKLGTTTLTLWSGGQVSGVYDLVITPDVTRLKRMIHEILPRERSVQVLSSGESITLSGSVSNTGDLTSVLSLAEAEAPGKVVNLLRVDGVQQVMLQVRVAEMSRTALKRMGINLAATFSNFTVYSFLNNLSSLANTGSNVIELTDKINSVVRYNSGSTNVVGMLDALKAHGLARLLAEPNLTCVSGESADFLVGGEIPIPKPGALGTVSIEFKPFGVGLEFTPTVLSSGAINLHVSPEVSELDYTNALRYQGYEIPAISTRKASTVVDLADGQSFAIAGLISESLKENNHRFPVLGDIPVLGTLFRSSDYQKNKTELVIIVTAHLVKPLDMAGQTLPGDGFKEPTDYEFYMLGLLEGQGASPAAMVGAQARSGSEAVVRPTTGFDGDFGHAWPR